MGTPMIDFAIREGKFCVDGPIAISRFGSCCSINKEVEVGNVVLASKGAFNIQTDYDLLHDGRKKGLPYKISAVTKPDQVLCKHMKLHLENSTPEGNFKQGLTGTSDSFYGSQCRHTEKMDDRNGGLYQAIIDKHPEATTMEMENYTIYALSNMSTGGDVFAASTSIVVANKFKNNKVLPAAKQTETEDLVGYSMFKSLADFDFPDGEPKFTVEMIKNVKQEESRRNGGVNKPLPYDRLRDKNPGLFE